MGLELSLDLPAATREKLANLADLDGIPPEQRVYDIIRKWVFERPAELPPPFGLSRARKFHLLDQSGSVKTPGRGRVVTVAEVRSRSVRYRIPNGEAKPIPDPVRFPIGPKLAEMLPLVCAYTEMVDLDGSGTEWSNLPEMLRLLVIEMVAQVQSDADAKESLDEAQALFPPKQLTAAKKSP